jgi:hypothetical protein
VAIRADNYETAIMTWLEAERLGLRQYSTGKACRNGHWSNRYTATGICLECSAANFRKWRAANMDRDKSNSSRWQRENKAKVRVSLAKDRARRYRRLASWADRKAIEHWYDLAEKITLATGVPHVVDHEVPLNGYRVCGLHVETNLQVMPQDMNRRKSNSFVVG